MIERMDEAVGHVLDTLEELELHENTYIVFTSDNGGVSSGDAFATSNLPLRGGKGRQWEGGIREPYSIRGPGITPGVCRVPVTGTDFYPTLLSLCDLPARPTQHQDGMSLVPLLKTGLFGRRDLFWHYPHYGNQGGEPSSMIRRGPWKLIHYWEDDRQELYNVIDDIAEDHDVAAQNTPIVAALNDGLQAWLKSVDATIPQSDVRYDQAKHDAGQERVRNVLKPRLERQHAHMLHPEFNLDTSWWGSLRSDD
jgi:arylsulfatase A-like enzyme